MPHWRRSKKLGKHVSFMCVCTYVCVLGIDKSLYDWTVVSIQKGKDSSNRRNLNTHTHTHTHTAVDTSSPGF